MPRIELVAALVSICCNPGESLYFLHQTSDRDEPATEDVAHKESGVEVNGAGSDGVDYGLDVSFPIHHPVSTNYEWLPHNVDPTNNPTPPNFKHMPLQPLGDRQQKYAAHLEGCREHYPKDASRCDVYEYDRILMNKRQPQSMQNYTSEGFKKIRAPKKVRELVGDFWEKNHHGQKPEIWPTGNTYTNHWKAPTKMVSVDDKGLRGSGSNLKRQIWDSARETIEDWTGEALTPTSMYGVRVYTEGAILLPHVDRLPLVSSAMVNVAQDVDEDWPMEIYDHNGQAHNVTLQPGDMLLFESHSVVHGRPFPLKGRYYAMLFIHFEPTGHSLRHSTESPVENVEKQYKEATEDGVGGQSAAAGGTLPPYIKRESPEEEHWRAQHPEGWSAPASAPRHRAPGAHRAAAKGDVKTVQKELSESPKTKEVVINERDDNGWQPLHEAAAGGHKDVVELLVNNGADLNARTHGGRGETPLYLAMINFGANNPVVRYLKRRGALSVGPEL